MTSDLQLVETSSAWADVQDDGPCRGEGSVPQTSGSPDARSSLS